MWVLNDDCWYPATIIEINNSNIRIKWLNPQNHDTENIVDLSIVRPRVEYEGQQPPFMLQTEQAILEHSAATHIQPSSPESRERFVEIPALPTWARHWSAYFPYKRYSAVCSAGYFKFSLSLPHEVNRTRSALDPCRVRAVRCCFSLRATSRAPRTHRPRSRPRGALIRRKLHPFTAPSPADYAHRALCGTLLSPHTGLVPRPIPCS